MVVVDPFQVSFQVSFPSFSDPFRGSAFHRTNVVCKQHDVGVLDVLGVMEVVGGSHEQGGKLDAVASCLAAQTFPGCQEGGDDTWFQEEGEVGRRGPEGTRGREEEGEEERVPQADTCLVLACAEGVAFCAAAAAAAAA
jgi:hypothetical protein